MVDDEDDLEEQLPTLAWLPLFAAAFSGLASPYALALYSQLLQHCGEGPYPDVSMALQDLAKSACMTSTRARQAMQELERLGAAYRSDGVTWVSSQSEWRAPRSQARSEEGHVYLLQHGSRFKIGFSTQYENRVQAIQRMLPGESNLVHSIRTDQGRQLEKFWHQCFQHLRDKGEWFNLAERELRWLLKTPNIRYLDYKMEELWLQYRVYAFHFYRGSKFGDELVWFFADPEQWERYAYILMHIWGLPARQDAWHQVTSRSGAWVHP